MSARRSSICAAFALVLAVAHLCFHAAFLVGSQTRSTEHVPQVTVRNADVRKLAVAPAGASGMRRRYVHDGAASGWQLMGCVISLMSTFKLVSATGNSRRQSRTPKKFRMHLSAAASSPGFVDDVHASLAPVPQALALPCEQTLLQAKMPGMMQPLATALHSELSCLFVHSMLQTVDGLQMRGDARQLRVTPVMVGAQRGGLVWDTERPQMAGKRVAGLAVACRLGFCQFA
eukprot:CAMPEP_0172716508 /NCGR_PEP_ID=MMETSP1074-20121228/68606_1 /TAXON_ID=2916 /ORGANISM="Ceratium fusus, Strain PA161109" /LENGTH=230 /DNA_ID=CAMNT_0013541223 /DNA_START=113 /DNA_END=806 /DNA_ORIENTATION=+